VIQGKRDTKTFCKKVLPELLPSMKKDSGAGQTDSGTLPIEHWIIAIKRRKNRAVFMPSMMRWFGLADESVNSKKKLDT
ncbi:MAG: hypothetical protein ACK5RH_04195, partial [Burkholderiales bacterium]